MNWFKGLFEKTDFECINLMPVNVHKVCEEQGHFYSKWEPTISEGRRLGEYQRRTCERCGFIEEKGI